MTDRGRARHKRPQEPDQSAAEELERQIGHRFEHQELLIQALTHSSAVRGDDAGLRDNERLEFLGDRVLGFVIAEHLFRDDPGAEEGTLALRLNALVRRETCAEVARKLGLGRFVIMASGEESGGGRKKPAILADACEALVAALYLDGGIEVAATFIKEAWGPFMQGLPTALRDPKSELQEYAQGIGRPLPIYKVVGRQGPDHAPRFDVRVRVEGFEPAEGSGSSRRNAEQAAAEAFLVRQGLRHRK